ncbi:MAG TPA: LysR substrate-binding domain-containing protein [Terriglobales bacterium]|nr:LysR substrate-binding domain-containing protein [Terriglobales bacterium]
MNNIELRHLRYFVAVGEELHFGRAARRLHLAQPPLSQQIRKLEEIIGHRLFTRTSRAVKLTSAGEIFLDRARRTLRSIDEDMEEVRRVGRGEVGFLKVGFIGSSMLTRLPAMLGHYRRQFPKVNLQLKEFHTSGVIQALLDNSLDVGFLRDSGPIDGLEVEPLFSEPFIAVVPSRHPLAKRKALSGAELRDEAFVFFSPLASQRAYDKAISICEAHGYRPRVVQEAPQWLTILRLVGAGLGVSIAPVCVQRIATPDVSCLKLLPSPGRIRKAKPEGLMSDIELAYRIGDMRPIVTTFCSIARDSLSTRSARNRSQTPG